MKYKLKDAIFVNPRESLPKGVIAKKVAMDKLQPFTRDIPSFEVEPYTGGSKFRNGDTIMARITPCLENGKTAKVSILAPEEVGFGSTEYIVLRAKPGITDPDFIYYLVCSPVVREPAIKSMVGTSGRQRVQTDVVENLEIDFPSFDEQHRVGQLLRLLDDKILLNRTINDNLAKQMRSFYRYLFVESADPDWKTGSISDLGEVVGGGTPSKAKPEYYDEHGIAWITPKDLSINRSIFILHGETDISDLGLRNSSATLLPRGTVLFSSRAPIGYIAIAAGQVSTNQGCKSVIPHKNVGTAFIYCFLKENLPIIEGMASGSTFKEVSGSVMKRVPAAIPDDGTLKRFTDFCQPLLEQQEILETQSRRLASMRDSLLPRLMSGEIDVSAVQL